MKIVFSDLFSNAGDDNTGFAKYFTENNQRIWESVNLPFVIARLCTHGLRDNIKDPISEISIIGPVRTNV